MRIEVIHFNVNIFPKHMNQIIFVDNAIWILRKHQQELILFRGQSDGLVIEDHLVAVKIDHEIFELDYFIILKDLSD